MRHCTVQHYLMCEPTEFTVDYEINPWMNAAEPVNTRRALEQWHILRQTYLNHGHVVSVLPAVPGLPDMVYAANAATIVDGVAYLAKMAYPQRQGEEQAYAEWLAAAGLTVVPAAYTNEGEGDFLLTEHGLLAGTGFRTDIRAHAEASEIFDRKVISLRLVDARFYHLDTALCVLDATTIAYYPPAFDAESRGIVRELFPDAIPATDDDAAHLGLNAVSDGSRVIVAAGAINLRAALRARGFTPIALDTSELLKGGGGAKCCTLRVRK